MKSYRLKITPADSQGHAGAATYIIRKIDGRVSYISAAETPLALSNLVSHLAAELRFGLEDCADGKAALVTLNVALRERWRNNIANMPKVTTL